MKKILLVLCLLLSACKADTPEYYLYVYYAKTCRVCDSLIKLVVNDVKEEYGNLIEVIMMDIDEEEHVEAYAKTCTLLEDYYINEDSGDVPFLVLDGYFAIVGFDIMDADLIEENISKAINNEELNPVDNLYYFKEGQTYR